MKHFLFLILLSFVFIQCQPIYYPNTVNTPMLTGKGDVNIGGHYGTSGINLQGAVAISDHVGIMSNTSYLGEGEDGESPFYTELGVGHFKKVGGKGIFEIYAGGGLGNEYNRLFMQPSIGLHTNALDLSFATRFIALDTPKNDGAYIEPALTLKLGAKNLKFMTQLGVSIPLDNASEESFPGMLSFGLEYRLFGKNKHSKESKLF